jgi:UDP-hydrolysing UDP-N-acetyl-D-glucosamine 2-epimerase
MKSIKVTVFTGTRADYGLLYWLINDIKKDETLKLQLLVSGSHLSPKFGLTYKQILEDGIYIDEKVEMLISSDSSAGIAKSMGLGMIGFADALDRLDPDIIVILGDRYEALAVAQTSLILGIPIFHLHGGEISEGAYDDSIRHAITKLSSLHATSTEEYRRRVIQLGEEPDRVINVGAMGLDYLRRGSFLNRIELSKNLKFDLSKPYFVVTYHPATLGNENPLNTFKALLDALDNFPNHQVILTYPNADYGGRKIIPLIESYALSNVGKALAIPSLGQIRYLSAIKFADAVIGNSSSGIIEAPAFDVPTVNIGIRQKGRLAAKSVLHCHPDVDEISEAISFAISRKYKEKGEKIINPYGKAKGDASIKVIKMIKSYDFSKIKVFHDLVK